MRNTIIMLIAGIIFLSFFAIILPVETCRAAGNTLYVDDDFNSSTPGWQVTHFDKIQDAVNVANESGDDTIYVYGGIYNENVEIDRPLTLTGIEGSGSTTVYGVDSHKHTIQATADNVYISGFTIVNTVGSNNHYHCVFLNSVTGCSVTNNVIMEGEYGVYLLNSNENTIDGNTVKDNDQKGIRLSNSDSNTIQGNVIQENGDGIYLLSSNFNEIYQNDIKGNGWGLWLHSSNNNIIYKNDFTDNSGGNAYDTGSNSWSYNSQGNYWDDYEGVDENPQDGIGDTPYSIPGGSNQDEYPLVYQEPVAIIDSISPSPATQGQTVSFNGHGADDGTIIDWEWSSSINGVLSSHSEDFSSSGLSVGTHIISFRVKDNDGYWSDPDTETLVINSQGSQQNQKPIAEIVTISPKSAEYGEEVYLHGYGTDSDGIVTGWSWRSSLDGFLSGEPSFTTADLSAGTHIIYFKVRDNDGEWSDEDGTSLFITSPTQPSNEPPTADPGGPYTGYVNQAITFDGTGSYDDDGSIVSYDWDFGDGNSSTEANPSYQYTSPGNYTVMLTVTDDEGATNMVATMATITAQSGNDADNDGGSGIPGFEIILVLIAITVFLILKKH